MSRPDPGVRIDGSRNDDVRMPHYKDGTEASLGDVIKGKPYNTPHEVVGVVVGITPGTESCNLRVMFTTRGQDSVGATPHTFPKQAIDYGETQAFEKLL